MRAPVSFSQEVRDELARIWPGRRCCQGNELAGFLAADSDFTFSHASVARKVYRLIKETKGDMAPKIRHGNPSTRNRTYKVEYDGTLHLAQVAPVNRCCLRSFLRGAFLSRGSLSSPDKGYHFEITVDKSGSAQLIAGIFEGLDLSVGMTERRSSRVLYLKGADRIAEALTLMGAHGAVLKLENVLIMKDVRNRVNRLVNSETANVQKTVNAAVTQLNAIQMIEDEQGISALPQSLQMVAKLRLLYPYASLSELGEMCQPKLSKSGVSYRMNRIIAHADRLEMKQSAP